MSKTYTRHPDSDELFIEQELSSEETEQGRLTMFKPTGRTFRFLFMIDEDNPQQRPAGEYVVVYDYQELRPMCLVPHE